MTRFPQSDPLADRRLVDSILGGDIGTFRVLVDREAAQVIAICRRILGNPTEAEDVAQESFLRAYRSLATYRGDGPFAAWIARIAARQALARLVNRPVTDPLDETAETTTVTAPAAEEPETSALADEQRAAIREAVATLPRPQRDVVLLRFFGELSVDEIARKTNTPVGTVKSRLHRGLASLRDAMPSRSQQ